MSFNGRVFFSLSSNALLTGERKKHDISVDNGKLEIELRLAAFFRSIDEPTYIIRTVVANDVLLVMPRTFTL